MSIIDAGAINVLSTGSGAFYSYVWPDPLQLVTTASAITQARNRTMNTQVAIASGGFGGGGATVNVSNSATFGTCVMTLVGGGADGVGQLVRYNPGTGPAIFQRQKVGQGIPITANNIGAGRVYANYAYNAHGGGSAIADSGLELTYGGGLIQSQSTAGVGFCRSANNTITARCQTVGGGASSNLTVTGAGTTLPAFNDQLMHSYEIQTLDATLNGEASITWLIDGVPVRRLLYGAGTVLPLFTGGTNTCWTALIPNVATLVTISVHQFAVIQAPTLANCF